MRQRALGILAAAILANAATSAMAGSSGTRMQRATPTAGSPARAGSRAIHAKWFT